MVRDNVYINSDEDYEIKDWLLRNRYRDTKLNQKRLREILGKIKKYYGISSEQFLKWQELDDYHTEFPLDFRDLEKIRRKRIKKDVVIT